jgi:hypothetical protein
VPKSIQVDRGHIFERGGVWWGRGDILGCRLKQSICGIEYFVIGFGFDFVHLWILGNWKIEIV